MVNVIYKTLIQSFFQGVPKSGEGFIDFIGQVHKTKEQFGQDGPICVHCRYLIIIQFII